MTPRPRGRATMLWTLALLLTVLAAHSLVWRWAEQRLQAGFASWAAERRAAGWEVRTGQPVAAGWPLAASLVVKQVVVEGGRSDIPEGFRWSADRVALSLRLLEPRALSIIPDGAQTLRLGTFPEIPYTADLLHVSVPLDDGAPARVADVDASGLRAGLPAGRMLDGLTVGLLRLRAEFRQAAPEGEPALGVQASAESITLPPQRHWALGGAISSASLDCALSGPVSRVRGFVRRATAWRDGGGTLDIKRFALGWGPLGLSGGATLALDQRLQPMGTGTARIVGYAETIDALAKGGVLTANAALAVKALASLIAAVPEGGGPAVLEVPLTLQARQLSMRQLPLARLPALQWTPE